MKKIIYCSFLLFSIFLETTIVHSRLSDYFYLDLKEEFGINTTIHFSAYGIQNIFQVPGVNISTIGNENILTYRTEFHNGYENGCVKIFNRIEENKLIPFFVLEEMVILERPPNERGYYKRTITKLSFDELEFDLFEIISFPEKKETKLMHVTMEKGDGGFKLKSIEVFQPNVPNEAAVSFTDVYEGLNERILSGEYATEGTEKEENNEEE
jgi:hypothetical protein